MVGLSEIDALPADQRSTALAGIGGMLSRVVPEETLLTGHVSGQRPCRLPDDRAAGAPGRRRAGSP